MGGPGGAGPGGRGLERRGGETPEEASVLPRGSRAPWGSHRPLRFVFCEMTPTWRGFRVPGAPVTMTSHPPAPAPQGCPLRPLPTPRW